MITVVLGKPEEDRKELRKRVEKGCEVFREKECDYIVLSGGKVNPELSNSEARAMKNYIEDISDEKIVLEEKSKGTIGNAYFTQELLESKGINVKNVFVVTSCYHSERAEYIFSQVFGEKTDIDASLCVDFRNPEAEKEEPSSFRTAKDFFKDIKPGDTESIREKLKQTFENVEL